MSTWRPASAGLTKTRPDSSRPSIGDSLGIGVAGLCALHCVTVPWLTVLLPWLGATVASERVETGLLFASLGVSGATLAWSRLRVHARWAAIFAFGAGAGLFLGVRMLHFEEEPVPLIVSGASFLMLGHWLNIRCRHAPCEACDPYRASSDRSSALGIHS